MDKLLELWDKLAILLRNNPPLTPDGKFVNQPLLVDVWDVMGEMRVVMEKGVEKT